MKDTFGQRLTRLLETLDISQADLARQLDTTADQINRLCHDVYTPSYRRVVALVELAEARGYDGLWLLTGRES